jgi:hypothetical protein
LNCTKFETKKKSEKIQTLQKKKKKKQKFILQEINTSYQAYRGVIIEKVLNLKPQNHFFGFNILRLFIISPNLFLLFLYFEVKLMQILLPYVSRDVIAIFLFIGFALNL